jgi:hypothetical protein
MRRAALLASNNPPNEETKMTTQSNAAVVTAIDTKLRNMDRELVNIIISLNQREAHLVAYSKLRGNYSAHSYFWFGDTDNLPQHLDWGHYDLTLASAISVMQEKAKNITGTRRCDCVGGDS